MCFNVDCKFVFVFVIVLMLMYFVLVCYGGGILEFYGVCVYVIWLCYRSCVCNMIWNGVVVWNIGDFFWRLGNINYFIRKYRFCWIYKLEYLICIFWGEMVWNWLICGVLFFFLIVFSWWWVIMFCLYCVL